MDTCCPARVASCWRGRTCPYHLRDACWFGHDDDLEGVPLCCDVAATSFLPPRTGTPVSAGLEADSEVKKEIVDYVGHWEEIVDVPVPLRRMEDDLGDRFLKVLEQIVEVLKVLPEQIARSFRSMGVPVPPDTEEIIDGARSLLVPQIRVQVDGLPVPQVTEETVDGVQGVRVPQIREKVDGLLVP